MFLESLFEGSRDRSHVKSPMVSSFCPWDPHFLLRTVHKKPFKYIGESVLLTSDLTKSILCCSEKILGFLFRDFVFTLAVTLANRRSGSQGEIQGQERGHKGVTRVHKGPQGSDKGPQGRETPPPNHQNDHFLASPSLSHA